MHTLTDDDLSRLPQQLIDGARRGEPALVTVDGTAVMMTVPLGKGLESAAVRVELAARLYDAEQISLGLAARIAGIGYSDMINELGQRGIATIRLTPGELGCELADFQR